MQLSREKKIGAAVGCVAFILALVVLFLFDPAHGGLYPLCWFHRLTGLNCPGCGSLRAIHHLLHGEVAIAFGCNPLLMILIPFAAIFLAKKLFETVTDKRAPIEKKNRDYFYWMILLMLVVFSVVRNLPYAIFAWMSP